MQTVTKILNSLNLNREFENSYFYSRGVSLEVFDEFGLGVSTASSPVPYHLVNFPIFPVFDINNQYVGYGVRPGLGGMKYNIQGFQKNKHLYGIHIAKHHILNQDSVIIVEGYFDVLLAHTHGFKNTVSCFGSSLSKEQILLLGSYTQNFQMSLDSDKSGLDGFYKAEKLIKKIFPSANVSCILVQPYKDFADYVSAQEDNDGQR